LTTTSGSHDDIPPAGQSRLPSSDPTPRDRPTQERLAFGKSYTWDDGVSLTVEKPEKFKPSKWAVIEKSKHYVKFTITVVNKSDKPVKLGLTYISVQSHNKEEDQLFDAVGGLKGPPDTKVLKGRKFEFDVGFGVTDPSDLVMQIALHDDLRRPSLLYST
jgi:hypothetical protein